MMNAKRLLENFDRIAEAPDAVSHLRRFILDLAVRGKLVEQDPNDETTLKQFSFLEKVATLDSNTGWLTGKFGNLLNMQYGKGLPTKDRKEKGGIPVFGSNGIVGFTDTALTDDPAIIVGRKGSAGALNLCNGASWTTDVAYFLIPPKFFDIRFLFFILETLDLKPTFRRCGIKMRYFILTLSYEYIDSRNPSPES
jgi:type I restriction enzyme, S subunit